MAQFGGFDDNWGLQAIVRGSSTASAFSPGPEYCGYNGDLDFQINDENGYIFSDENLFQSHHQLTMLTDHHNNDEFQQIYQPFYPVWDSSSSSPPHDHQHITPISNHIKLQESDRPKQLISSSPTDQSTSTNTNAQTTNPKYKRRKNQQKRVVIQSAAGEGVPSDVWAWRKYGQKPIKGSPYPRSYYRCSTSKSCIAKKQVEQSCTEAGVTIITYTAEHNHPQPIRKNALAGTTRQKFPITTTQITPVPVPVPVARSSSSNYCYKGAEMTSTSRGGDEIVKQESNEEEINNKSLDIKMEEEFFAGLEDLDGFISELLVGGQQQQHQQCSSTSKMFSMNFYNY